ncbi:uncharacterized protein HMPREF1541_09968 [Cyphellophora europaea CBS 101466]|uniref:Uncharacterized protein n=1 Tax=Cyphellophora europaea (strain CBS 101466) TaxID=1220924 RepID=W2S8T8_CYPE1|nr:uncharacterized protein HMPREF1541_09968 [Cyphellophora europaea CBS 101466]ETN45092.1 hypothetical protein HMPREF1541_09968 [Cyphellophora europaea CBS 101466]
MGQVFERVMRQYYTDCWILPLTQARIWEIREAVWSSRWFRSEQFERIVLELYHSFLRQTLTHVKPRLPDELVRLKDHAGRCQGLDMIMGEEFVPGIRFRDRRPGGQRRRSRKGDLVVTFNSISVHMASQEHQLQFWGISHLYDLPDGLFLTPITSHQIRLLRFLNTLDWHWNSRSVLAPKRNEAMSAALSWAIGERNPDAIIVLLQLYHKYCRAGNCKVLNVNYHLQECVKLRDPAVLHLVGSHFGLPPSVVEFFQRFGDAVTTP